MYDENHRVAPHTEYNKSIHTAGSAGQWDVTHTTGKCRKGKEFIKDRLYLCLYVLLGRLTAVLWVSRHLRASTDSWDCMFFFPLKSNLSPKGRNLINRTHWLIVTVHFSCLFSLPDMSDNDRDLWRGGGGRRERVKEGRNSPSMTRKISMLDKYNNNIGCLMNACCTHGTN